MQRKAAVASMKAEDFARRFESGSSVDAPKDSAAEDQSQSNVNVMCRLCFSGENEGSERARRMLPCRSCGKKYHRSCLKVWSQHRDLFHWSSWTCPSCRTCEICRRTGEANKFKFCKRCDGAVHCYCMQPPHKNVSSGPYLCPKHTKCHSCESKVPGNGLSLRWFLAYTCCDACGRLFTKGNYCPVCLKVYRDSESTPMVCCDVCQRWVHCQCDGISDERYMQFQIDRNLPYTCPTCRGECYQVRDLEDAVRELWRRRDEADQDLIASLRAAAGLPTEEEFFSIWPFSDDDDDIDGPSIRGVFGRAKLSYKSEADFLLKKTKESVKKSSKKHVKKKGLQLPMDSTTAANYEEHHDAPFDASHQADSISPSITGSISPTVRMCSVNELGGLKEKFIDEVVVNNEDRKPSVLHFKSKINDNGTTSSEDVGKAVSKPQTKGTKLVIHLGGRNKITDPPISDSSSYQREQAFMLNGSEAGSENRMGDYAVHKFDGSANCDDGYRVDGIHEIKGLKPRERTRIKLSKGKSQASGINAESGTSTGLSSPESSAPSISVRRSNDGGAAAVGLRKKVSKVETMPLQKHPEHKPDQSGDNFKSGKQASLASDALAEDSRPLLRFKFKTPFPGSWPLLGEEESGAVKGQRSKRKRPPSLVEKARQQEQKDVTELHDKDVRNEIMDANWVLEKLGRDAIGKRVEVHQPSDNSWHKGVVSDVVEETSMLSIGLDDGRSKTFELGKQGIRFVPQKDKRLK